MKQRYSSNMKSLPFLFLEMKRTAILLCDGKDKEEILALSTKENIYQLDKEKRRREMPLKMYARLSTLNQALVDVIARGHDREARIVAFFAMMKSDRLLFEYMYEVYAGKYAVQDLEIADRDYEDFIDRKIQNSEKVASWKTDNLIRVRSVIKSTLVEAGLAKKKGSHLEILAPVVDDDFCNLFDVEDTPYMRAIALLPR